MSLSWQTKEYTLLHGDPCLVTYDVANNVRKVIDQRPLQGDFAIAYDAENEVLLKYGNADAVQQWTNHARSLYASRFPDIAAALTVLTIPRHALTAEILEMINRTLNCSGQLKRLVADLQTVTNIPVAPPAVPA